MARSCRSAVVMAVAAAGLVGGLLLASGCGSGGGGGGDAAAPSDGTGPLDLALGELPGRADVPAADVPPGAEDTPGGGSDACAPECGDRVCGDDGCGGSCGDCDAGEACQAGACVGCTPSCPNKECGDNGCDGSCGDCDEYYECDVHVGRCVLACLPNCAGRRCGSNGCGGDCGSCDAGLVCNTANGLCGETCNPYCTNRECGTNGCGGSCGAPCPFPESCNEYTGRCVDECVRQCAGRECGDDGCGARCGYCPAGYGCGGDGRCSALPLTCAGIRACARQCPHDDVPCAQACRAAGDPASAVRYDAVAVCEQSNCAAFPPNERQTCMGEACAGVLLTCGLDLVCGDPGTQACMTAAGCMGGCADAACLNTCLCQADEPSFGPARAMAECIVQNCPSFEATCMSTVQMGSCLMQWMGCMGTGL